ncbi:hypothetical protein Goklo_007416 [Gossypium klotzschianum]|uniref:Uncharacterized protein n=1 Tax=Gossypium klotzschianum TaxID=34286 RepID=A0A7J8WD70_9ROSI|nr:hypothetical protein [Gossypium klotzschianum]
MLGNATTEIIGHMLVGYMNRLLSLTRDKKTSAISSIYAPMEEDISFSFPLRYGLNQQ